MPRPISVVRLLLAMLLAFAALCASAEPPLTLRYGGDRDFAPFESLDANGKPQGYQIDLLHELERAGNLRIDIELRDWPDIESGFREGRYDMLAMSHTESRTAWALFARTHVTPAMGIYVASGTAMPAGMQDLANMQVMYRDSEPMRQTLKDFFSGPRYHFIPADSSRAALEGVRDGKADAALILRAYGDPLLRSGEVHGIDVAPFNLELQGYAFAVRPGRAELAERISGAIDQLEEDGTLERLHTKWLASHRESRARTELGQTIRVQWIAGVLLGVVGIGALVIAVRRLRAKSRAALRERELRAQTEAALAAAREQLARLVANHPDGIIVLDVAEARVIEANPAMAALFGMAREALVGQQLEALPVLAAPHGVADLRSLMRASGSLEAVPVQLRGADGLPRNCLVHAEYFESDGRSCVFALVRDVTRLTQDVDTLRSGYHNLLELTRAQREALDAAQSQLGHVQRAAAEFTSHVAHDLRGPVNAIRVLSDFAREDLARGAVDGARQNIGRIDRAARHMDDLIEGMTRLAVNDRAPLDRQHIDMHEMVTGLWDAVLRQTGCRVAFRCAPLPAANADARLAPQVWQNLLANACKFCARVAEPAVAVDSFLEGGRTWFRVADNGVGFDMNYAELIFQPYRRAHSGAEFPGSGIGLAIVSRIIERHDGEIRARSNVGVGSVFEFTFDPVPQPRPAL